MRLKTFISSLLIGTLAFASNPVPSNNLKVGDGTASNKALTFNRGANNPVVRWNESASQLEFSNDGVNFSGIGSGSGSGSGGFNVLTNPGFESGITQGWSNTGGSFLSVSSGSNVLFEKKSATFQAFGSGSFFASSLYTVPNGLAGGSCSAGMEYKGGDSNLTFEVVDGSSNVLSSQVLTASSITSPVLIVFPCPASGQFQVKLISTAASALVAVDQMFLGQASIVPISQAQQFGTIHWAPNTGASWTQQGASYSNMTTVGTPSTPTITGNAKTPSGTTLGVNFASMPAGTYRFVLYGAIFEQGGAQSNHRFRFSDGTNNSSGVNILLSGGSSGDVLGTVEGQITYPTAQSNVTVQLQGFCLAADICTVDTGTSELELDVYYFPSQSQNALTTPAQSPMFWSGYHAAADVFTTTSASYADPGTAAGSNFVQRQNINFGTVTSKQSSGNDLPGIVFTPQKTGGYFVCANGTWASSAGAMAVRLTDGTNVVWERDQSDIVSNNFNNFGTCGLYYVSSTNPVTLSLQFKVTSGTLTIGPSGAPSASTIEWSIIYVSTTLPQVLLPNSVTSASAAVERVDRVSVTATCTADPCTIASQSGTWVTAINRVTNGEYTVHFAATEFSSAPSCVCSPYGSGDVMCNTNAITTSSAGIEIDSFSGANTDRGIQLICQGPH